MSRWVSSDEFSKNRTLTLKGRWRMATLREIFADLKSLGLTPQQRVRIDGSQVEELDTSGAMLIFQYLLATPGDPSSYQFVGFQEGQQKILALVKKSYAPGPELRSPRKLRALAKIGFVACSVLAMLADLLEFIGYTAIEIFRTFLKPKLFRLKEFFVQLEIAGLDAIPIVSLVTFLIGIVIAYLFGIQIEKYGANILIVNAVTIAMCRELSPILVAILIAGRSGSAFTAQIGTMKLNEEIDAMHTLGLSPMKVLVLPRVFALMLAMPLLVFVGDVAGITGSMLISNLRLGVTGYTFLERLQVVLPLRSFYVGLVKAPVFALFIAVIGCRMGLAVENNARSVGLNTTRTVVRSIVAVILLNAAFAIIFVELGI